MNNVKSLVDVATLADLREQPFEGGALILLRGGTTPGDMMVGLYYWDSASTLAEDLVYSNVLRSNLQASALPGRWRRLLQRTTVLPQGLLVTVGNIKTLYADAVTDANGRLTVNATLDNTATGTAIFTTLYSNDAKILTPSTTLAGVASTYPYSISADNKVFVHQVYKPNIMTLVLNLVYNPFAVGQAGVSGKVIIVGQ